MHNVVFYIFVGRTPILGQHIKIASEKIKIIFNKWKTLLKIFSLENRDKQLY